ncbi:MAG TPA: nitroreductase [Clostridiales bacterium]|nr:nitroreductase [Clostridiales bacterium]
MTGVGAEFVEKTKYRWLGVSDQQKGVPPPPLEKPADPSKPIVDLPDPSSVRVRPVDLTEAIAARTSVRKYAPEPVTLDEVSYLLWCTQGVKEVAARHATLRTVPSAGARHPFETYLLANRVEGLEPGLYRFLAISHRLQEHDLADGVAREVHEATLGQYVLASAVTFIWAAVPYRTSWRYQERGWRYLFLDAGHVCQNLYLAVQAVGAGCCAIAAFDDDRMNRVLGLDGEREFVVYVATVGKTRVRSAPGRTREGS